MDRKQTAYYVLCQPSSNNCAAVVSYMADYFKQKGLYFTSSKDLCKGDIVFFQNDAGLSHVGICVDWGDTWFNTVEGNKGDEVKLCGYSYNQVGGYVAGFAHPRYNENCTAEDAIDYAFSQIGYRESGNNWNKYAAELDEIDYFAGCGKKQNLPWCAVFICAVMYNAYKEDPTPTPPTPPTPTKDEYTVSTSSGDALRLRAEANADSKQVGYIPNGNKIKSQKVVEGESIGNITAWVLTEDGIFYDGYSQGYASGKYLTPTPQVDPDPEPQPTPSKVVVELDTLSKGSTGGQVKTIQALLNGFIGSNLSIDGIFGSKTEQGVKDYQKSRGLTVDGVVGAETWNKILK